MNKNGPKEDTSGRLGVFFNFFYPSGTSLGIREIIGSVRTPFEKHTSIQYLCEQCGELGADFNLNLVQ
jgi:hypothetical protein